MSHEDIRTRATTWWASILRGKVAISRLTEASVPLDLRKYLLTPPGLVQCWPCLSQLRHCPQHSLCFKKKGHS